jgi:hypothetical protein
VKDRRIMSVCCGVIVIAVYVDFNALQSPAITRI